MGRGVWPIDSSSDRLLLNRRSEVDDVDVSNAPPPMIRERTSAAGWGFRAWDGMFAKSPNTSFLDLCRDPPPTTIPDSDKDSNHAYIADW